ncbi:MAG: type II secretion system minor pseudopilin GspH [Wenzhouxiangella sp.]|jgi:type II secretion system protein H|nr:type II secretion system minor pseudopilin GspH [Wenzhouxiangella sp.]
MKPPISGFTLIELLVVVTIAAILSALVVLSLGNWSSPEDPKHQLSRLAALLEQQCEQALFQSRARGLRVTDEGFDFWQSGPDGWQALPDSGAAAARRWPEGLAVELLLEGRQQGLREEIETPQIHCQPLGQVTPFELALEGGGQRARLLVSGNGHSELASG